MYDSFKKYVYENLKKIGNYCQNKRVTFLEQWIEVNMDKIVILRFYKVV